MAVDTKVDSNQLPQMTQEVRQRFFHSNYHTRCSPLPYKHITYNSYGVDHHHDLENSQVNGNDLNKCKCYVMLLSSNTCACKNCFCKLPTELPISLLRQRLSYLFS